ncbi:MAG: hypothetical protein HKN03_15825 [Acidimicrobiales bacterium]|nr:hypothetical protein [Acidimicrobiales bacterium]
MGMKRSQTLASVVLALSVGAAACVADDPTASPVSTLPRQDLNTEDIVLTSGLQTVGNCDALLSRLIDEGLERVGPYGFGGNFVGFPVEVMEDAASDGASEGGGIDLAQGGDSPAAYRNQTSGEDDSYSSTNAQETGVDEADIVKTDGSRMIVVSNNMVHVLDISGAVPVLKHSVKMLNDYGQGEIFINGDQALLMSTSWTDSPILRNGADLSRSYIRGGQELTTITTINLDAGTVGRSIEFVGSYVSAREVDGTVRVVVRAGMGNFGWLFPSNPNTEDAATKANQDLLRQSTIDDWLPAYRVVENGDTVDSGLLFECDRTHLPAEFAGFGSIGLLTVDANNGFTLTDSLGVITDGQTVYASTDRLTVATPRYPEWDNNTGQPKAGEVTRVALHNFDITDPARASYVASGSVNGELLNQYSLSEYNGYLRVATTQRNPNDWNDSSSSITVLAERDGALIETGRVDGLGKNEQIFAVRYQGDTAYVVTFRQTDPLYVIDLRDPAAPATLGELKIPGFSNYLHPLGDGLMMGVGQDATDEGRQRGAQASLFDVSDPANPQRIATLSLGGESSSSIVQWDARAFTFWSPTNTAIIPVESWEWNERTESNAASARLVRVEGRSLVDAGSVRHSAQEQCDNGDFYPVEPLEDVPAQAELAPSAPPTEQYCWSYAPGIMRTVIANGTLYTVSQSGVHSWDLATLAPGQWVSFGK